MGPIPLPEKEGAATWKRGGEERGVLSLAQKKRLDHNPFLHSWENLRGGKGKRETTLTRSLSEGRGVNLLHMGGKIVAVLSQRRRGGIRIWKGVQHYLNGGKVDSTKVRKSLPLWKKTEYLPKGYAH